MEDPDEDTYAKWEAVRARVLVLVAVGGLLPAVTQTMYLPAVNEVIRDLDTSEELVAWTLSVYALGSALCPMGWGPLSDRYGRRMVFLVSLSIFCAAGTFSAYAWDVYALIIARGFQALGFSAAGVVGAGSIADVYPPAIRGNAMGWYSAMALTGTVVGPVMGGFVGEFLGWRAIFGTMAIAAGLLLVLMFFFLPETLSPTGPKRSASPINAIKLFLDPSLLILFAFGGALGGCILLVLFIFPLEASTRYGMSESEIGLAYVPFGMGTVLGMLGGGKTTDACFRYKGLGGRLIPAFGGALGMIASLVLFAWTIERSFWLSMMAVSAIGFLLTFSRPGLVTFAVEQRPRAASSVQACMSSFSSLCGFAVLNAGPIVIEVTSIRWAFSGYSISIILICVPLFFLMCSWLGYATVEDKRSSSSSSSLLSASGKADDDDAVEPSERTPLKQTVKPSR